MPGRKGAPFHRAPGGPARGGGLTAPRPACDATRRAAATAAGEIP
jgi:hypothetical protein